MRFVSGIIVLLIGIVLGIFAASRVPSGATFGFILGYSIPSAITIAVGALILAWGLKAHKCPFCAELVKSKATVCKHCGREIPTTQPEHRLREDVQPVVAASTSPQRVAVDAHEQLEAKQASAAEADAARAYVYEHRKMLLELCEKLNSNSLSFYEYQLLAPVASAAVGLVTGVFSTRYSIERRGETLLFDRCKDLRPWFQSNVVHLVTNEAQQIAAADRQPATRSAGG